MNLPKFRAWHKHLHLMMDVESIDYKFEQVFGYSESIFRCWSFSNIELEQFTGLHDKNSLEIYEGDIAVIDYFHNNCSKCTVGDKEIYTGKIEYEESNFVFNCNELTTYFLSGFPSKNIKIIGNIHQHQELLETK